MKILPRRNRRNAGPPIFAALDGLVLHQLVLGERDVTEAALAELRSLLRLLATTKIPDS